MGILSYVVSLCIMASIYAVLALGLNVQWGFAGLFNIGVAGFFMVGAYVAALVTMAPPTEAQANYVQMAFALDLPFLIGIGAAAAVCALLALLIGAPVLKLGDDYLAIASIGIAESTRHLFRNEDWLANGVRGLVGIPQPLEGLVRGRYYNFIYLIIVVAVLAAVFFIVNRSTQSPWGRVLRAVRDDELSASMSGKDVAKYRIQALVFGAMIMGVGGAMFAHYIRFVSPDSFTPIHGTFIVWVMVVAGGSGNNRGVVTGAVIVWGIWTLTQFVTDAVLPGTMRSRAPYIRFIIIGVLLEVILLTRPEGLIPERRRISRFLAPLLTGRAGR